MKDVPQGSEGIIDLAVRSVLFTPLPPTTSHSFQMSSLRGCDWRLEGKKLLRLSVLIWKGSGKEERII